MTAHDLARRVEPGALATATPIDQFRLLDQHTGTLIEPRAQPPTLAVISAGYNANAGKEGRKQPVVARDGTIHVNGYQDLARAFETVPGLARALQATGRKRLTVTFAFDDPGLFIRQHFAARSASALLAYGDAYSITRIVPAEKEFVDPSTGQVKRLNHPEHVTYPAGSPEYRRLLPHLKVETSIYFLLSEWIGNQSEVIFLDGVALYRLRMTSHNSAHNIVNSLRWVSQLTGGRFAGVPFDLWHQATQVPGPDGMSRTVPVWNLIPKPPDGLKLSSGNFREVFAGALTQGEQLKILPPPSASMDLALQDEPTYDSGLDDDQDDEQPQRSRRPKVEPTAEEEQAYQAMLRQHQGKVDPATARRTFFGTFKDTLVAEEEGRAAVLREFTKGKTTSLSVLLEDCTDGEFANLIAFGKLWLSRHAEAQRPPRQTFRVQRQQSVLTEPTDEEGAVVRPYAQAWTDLPDHDEPELADQFSGGLGVSRQVDDLPEPPDERPELNVEPDPDPNDQPSLLDLDSLPPVRSTFVASPVVEQQEPTREDDDMLSVARSLQRDLEQAKNPAALQEVWASVESQGLGAGFLRALREVYDRRGTELVRGT